jgi:hypothetical protein
MAMYKIKTYWKSRSMDSTFPSLYIPDTKVSTFSDYLASAMGYPSLKKEKKERAVISTKE